MAHAIEQSPAAGMRDGRGAGSRSRATTARSTPSTAVLLAGVLYATRDREEDRISGAELLPLGAATFALSKVIAREKIGAWVREPFVDDAVHPHRPAGRRVRRAVGELVMCTRCVGAWSALGLVGPARRLAAKPAGP